MKKSLLSVIIPAYNVENYIQECIESIRKQTYQDLEIIVIDDGSTDNTAEICKYLALKDKRIIFISQANRGVTGARTRGVEVSSGKYVTFVDADDYIQFDMYEKMISYISSYDLVVCGVVQKTPKNGDVYIFDSYVGGYEGAQQMEAIWQTMLYDFEKERMFPLYPSLWNKIFKKDKLLPIMQRMDTTINYGEDTSIVLQYLLQCNSVMFLKEAFYFYRYREASVVHSLNPDMLKNVVGIYNILKPIFDDHSMSMQLNRQLEKWMILLLVHSVNKYMGFSRENRLPQFWVNLEEYKDKKLLVYGAGEMGQDVVWQYSKMRRNVFAWVDRDYELYQKQGMNVNSIDILKKKEIVENIDIILIAVSKKGTAEHIKEYLLEIGVPGEKIVWKKPIGVY